MCMPFCRNFGRRQGLKPRRPAHPVGQRLFRPLFGQELRRASELWHWRMWKFQEGETCEAKWVDFQEFVRMAKAGELSPVPAVPSAGR